MAKIEIYTRDMCGFCARAKKLLKTKNIKFDEYNIWQEDNRKPEMVKRANGATSVPQIFINNDHVGGCDDLMALEKAGNLDKLLQLD